MILNPAKRWMFEVTEAVLVTVMLTEMYFLNVILVRLTIN